MKDKCLAGIVLYNPKLDRIKENVDSILPQVQEVILVDNGSQNISEIESMFAGYDGISIVKNVKNEGIAAAINTIMYNADSKGYEFFLTLDQDSVCREGLIDCYMKYVGQDIGQMTCNMMDRNVGLLTSFEDDETYTECEGCITSGAFNNTKIMMEIGGAYEPLFIDGVDLDISYRIREAGYKVIHVHYMGLVHELGEGKTHKFFGKSIVTSNHSPMRNYYARRNLIYVARKHLRGKEKVNKVTKQIIYAIGTIILEDQKLLRIKNNFKGIFDGFRFR